MKDGPLCDWLSQCNTAGCSEKVEPISTFFAAAQTATAKTDRSHSHE